MRKKKKKPRPRTKYHKITLLLFFHLSELFLVLLGESDDERHGGISHRIEFRCAWDSNMEEVEMKMRGKDKGLTPK